ncbi:hypothetical protein [Helicobacter zhangjianzhongii]|uniref:Uncharacterized protein n=1 Tax=Helicobacter zhangjianzhongii TaxID=2974574 RepID=A0ACC6FTE7_9HELI|nr:MULTISPECIES: hypothetical protein [unclassified Helicobacter]MDL0080365.1 hypothetical protein [Helicobacter sp. CPD2-1]MDL0082484.1 hypothetical protein [Helicobacter sp. XJK30-2]
MEENLEKLRKIGVKEIAKQTRISTSRIQDILDKQFEHTQRVHLVGFLQILEREYKLDLSGVLKAYDDQHNTTTIEEPTEKSVQVQDLSLDTQKQRYDAIDERKKQANSKQKFYLTLVSVAIVIFAYLIYQNIASKYKSQPSPQEITQESDVQSNEQDLTQATDDTTLESTQENTSSDEPQSSQDESTSDSTQTPQGTQEPDSSHLESTQAPSNAMVLNADMDLWFDIVDLDTNRRKYQGVTSDTYSIKTDNHRWLLAFGHSNFTLTMNGEPFAFPKSNYPLYFIYEPDNGFRKIDPQTYKRLAEQVR